MSLFISFKIKFVFQWHRPRNTSHSHFCLLLHSPTNVIVGHPEPEKINSVGLFEYILASMLNVYLDVF